MTSVDSMLPPLPFAEWSDTKDTLHLFLQMIGKVRMKAHPKLNHWWHVTLYPDTRGLTTGRIPFEGRSFQINYDMIDHAVTVSANDGRAETFAASGQTVASFYGALFGALEALGFSVSIVAKPYDNKSTVPFPDDHAARAYDEHAVNRFWRALCSIASVFEEFRSQFVGKQTPVHLYWHSFDLVSTRFSGTAAPLETGRQSDLEAYSHEVISTGFWPGDDTYPHAAFYGYAYPEPKGLSETALTPASARWIERNGGALAIFDYEALRKEADPHAALLSFLNSVYEAGVDKAGWDRAQYQHRFLGA